MYKHNTGFCGIPLRDKCGLPWTLIASNLNFPRRNWHIYISDVLWLSYMYRGSFAYLVGDLIRFIKYARRVRGRPWESSMPGRTNVVIFHAGKNDVK